MRLTARFLTIVILLGTSLIVAPGGARPAEAAAILWTPPLLGNLATGSAAECVVVWTGKKASKPTATIVVDLIRGDTGAAIATASATGPFSPGVQVAAVTVSSTPTGSATECRITATAAPKSHLGAVLEMFSAVTGVPSAAVPLVR